jgi:hypothetical protein
MRRIIAPPILAAIAIMALSACTGSLHLRPAGPNNTGAVALPLGGSATVPLSGRTVAELHIVAGFTAVSITTGATGADLIRASTPAGSGLLPVVTVTGNVAAVGNRSAPSGGGNGALLVVLNRSVRWQVSLDGGASSAIVDLTGAQVSGVDLTQGVSSLEVTLPAQAGTIPMTIAAGVSSLRVHVSGSEPARATLSAGAGNVVIDGVAHSGIAAGTSFASSGWDTSANRVDIQCSAGISTLLVDQV